MHPRVQTAPSSHFVVAALRCALQDTLVLPLRALSCSRPPCTALPLLPPGKKGVEIEGASDMGGLDFFCTTIETPDGDTDLLLLAMEAMNAQPDAGDEERKGCSGHVTTLRGIKP